MNRCLYCQEPNESAIGWASLFKHRGDELLCKTCRTHFHPISYNYCPKCYKMNKEGQCPDCNQWIALYKGHDPLIKNVSLYEYTEWMKEVITQWKYRGDYVIGEIFRSQFQQLFVENFKDIIKESIVLPIPLSSDRLYERGFNQASQLASFLVDYCKKEQNLLCRLTNEKQSKKSREERLRMENPFNLKGEINKTVILVDDIYTTGQTLRHAAILLKEKGCPQVYSYTLVRG